MIQQSTILSIKTLLVDKFTYYLCIQHIVRQVLNSKATTNLSNLPSLRRAGTFLLREMRSVIVSAMSHNMALKRNT